MGKEHKILIINAGSFSLKYSFFVGFNLIKEKKFDSLKKEEDYLCCLDKIFNEVKEFDFIIHRVVHGGDLKKPYIINERIKKEIRKYSQFAPLHNPIQLRLIEECEKRFKNKKQYAVFDTMFFSDLSEVAKTYAIPLELTKKYKIRRYGFHGLSHKSIVKNIKGKTITCHLGSGASISAIINGKPIDTSMGLTPLEGIVMGTRSGSIDSGIIFFLQKKGYDVEKILNEKSGLKGICNFEDFRKILKNINKDKKCKLAYDLFIYSIIKHIGMYISVMNGLDNLIFTGAIGENSSKIREDICNHFSYLTLRIDKEDNNKNKEIISSKSSKINVLVKKSEEEKEALKEVLNLLNKKN